MEINLVLTSNPYYQNSASANRLLTLIEGIANQGTKVNLLIFGGYTHFNEREKFGQCGTFKNIAYEYVLPTLIEGYWKIRYYKYIGHNIRSVKLKKVLIRKLNINHSIIWLDTSSLSLKLAIQLRNKNPQLKLFTEMSEFLDIHNHNKGNFLQRWQGDYIQRTFEKKTFYSLSGMALMTQTLIKHYQDFPQPHPRFLHLPMTVDLERFEQPKKALEEFRSPYLAFVGVMNDAKDGVSTIINAFNIIKHKYPNYKLYLVGGYNYDTPNHLKLIKEFQLEKRVLWMKEYPRDKIPNIICNADLLVLPRPNSKQAQGGFPTKLGEYLATGNPVCATRVGEIPDYLVDNESVFFAEPGDVNSFADAMIRALSDKENARRVGLNGRKVAEREFNKDIQAKKLFDFLKQL